MFDVQHRDERLPLKEWVLGVEIDGHAKAYPFSALSAAVDARGELIDRVAGKRLRIRYDAREPHRARPSMRTDTQWPATMAFWFAWVAFHPKTEVLRAP